MMSGAKWIQSPVVKDGAALFFQRTFALSKEVRRAELTASAMGVYMPYCNGRAVTQDLFLPGWTSYSKRIQVQKFDVTAYLGKENTLSLLCAPGWAVGQMGFRACDKNYADQIAVIAGLNIEYADGSREVIATDGTWQVLTSQILYSDIYDGETVDRTAAMVCLGAAEETQISTVLVPHEGAPVREQEHIAPVRAFTTPRGERVIDFGQNIAGYVAVSARGKRGERIVMRHAEVLDAEGNFYTDNLRSAKATNTYVLSGEGTEVFKPTFSWQGFRYICLDECPQDAAFTAIVVHSQMERTGSFVCGHEGINQLYRNTVWGQKGNFLDVPTDCPQRDERLGWLGDAQAFCQTAAIHYDVLRFFKKWLKDVALDQEENGALRGIAPVVMDRAMTRISSAWGDAGVICPWVMYMTYGDREILENQFESMCRWIGYIRDHAEGGRYLWTGGKHYGDWLAMDNGPGVYEGATSKDLISTAFYAYSTSLLIRAGHVLGRDMSGYEALHAGIVRAFRETYMKDDLPAERTQTACTLALHFGLCENPEKTAALLSELIRENGGHLNTGFVGTPYLLYALSENGYEELAYDLLLQEGYPGWLYPVKLGATTMWEHWDSVNDRGEMWSADMNSFNHYAYGAVGEWLYRTVTGVRTVEHAPGYGEILLCPVPDSRLGFAEAKIVTKHGTIRSAWYVQEGRYRYEFTVPQGVRATICLPGRESIQAGEGEYVF